MAVERPGRQPLRPAGWASPRGYSEGVVTEAGGRLVLLAGQIGWNPATATIETNDFVAQARQALRNVVAILAEAGGEPRHLVRLTWYVVDREEYLAAQRELGGAYREVIGDHYPAMSLVVVAGLVAERARVEIEATAVLPVASA